MNEQSAIEPTATPTARRALDAKQWRAAAWSAYLHPASLLGLGLLWVNDHALKARAWPSAWVAGKLSDVCGLLFFPLMLNLLCALALSLVVRALRAPWVVLWGCCVSTALGFCAVKLSPGARALYLDALQAAFPWLYGPGRPPHLTLDPTDLIALPMIGWAAHIGAKALRRVA